MFAEQYSELKWPLTTTTALGLRLPQAGALHAIGAHFSNRSTSAIITMPTGSGKTAVLMATPFLLRATRVLVVTPSRLVREQIAERFAQLDPLRALGVIDRRLTLPDVREVRERITSASKWESLRTSDVIVGTPQSLSPGMPGVVVPPDDLFDLVLVDEAHHSPAPTWADLLERFPRAQRVLFTATPYRTDRLEIPGDFVYTYDLRAAFEDGVFGALEFVPIDVAEDQVDVAIARRAEQLLLADRQRGLRHLVMVRTATKVRAHELESLYARETKLRLKSINSGHTLSHIRSVIHQLRHGELDGIICVDMLGEGFDLPELKIAALHSPHRSLAVTLQFIGRFARTTSPHIGRAAFVGSVSEMAIEKEALFAEGAVWEDIIPRLADTRIATEVETQRILTSFAPAQRGPTRSEEVPFVDISLRSITPYRHAKIYAIGKDATVNVGAVLHDTLEGTVVYHRMSADGATIVLVTEQRPLPEWTENGAFAGTVYDLVVVYHDVASRLLFIHSSDRNDGLFDRVAHRCITGPIRTLSLSRLNKVLIGLENPEFFNIGMRNRVVSTTTETYRIITGSDAARAVRQSDGRLYHRGHFFGRGEEGGAQVTLGLSSMAKVWSNAYDHLPQLLGWFRHLAGKLTSAKSSETHSGLDYLSTGREVDDLPPDIIAADWDREIYDSGVEVEWSNGADKVGSGLLIDSAIRVIAERSTTTVLALEIDFDGFVFPVDFAVKRDVFFSTTCPAEVHLRKGKARVSLIDMLNVQPLSFYTASMALLRGNDLYEEDASQRLIYDPSTIEVVDWSAANVDICAEIESAAAGQFSIHQHLENTLGKSNAAVVFYDHGKGEIADFVVVETVSDTSLAIRLYHCKGSATDTPAVRVGDSYEVVGQAIKSIVWATRRQLRDAIKRRARSRLGRSRFVRGDIAKLDGLLGDGSRSQLSFEIVIVQPGISRGALNAQVGELLAATNDYLIRGGCGPLRVQASA